VQVALLLIVFWIVRVLCLSVFFRGFHGNINSWTGAGETSFIGATPFHSWSIVLRSLLNPIFSGVLIVLYIPHFIRRKTKAEYTQAERIVLCFFAFIITWELITYDYNYYLDSAFYFDRFVLLALCLALFRFPVLTPLFIAFALVYRAQFNYPVTGFPLLDIRILYDILIMYSVHHYMRLFVREFAAPVLYFILCITAGYYLYSGLDKLFISPHGYEWLFYNDPADLYNNVCLRGWLACSSETVTGGLRAIIMRYGELFQWIVFFLEVGVVIVFRKRRAAIVWLIALMVMHAGIFLFGSMLFWKLMLVDAVLLLILIFRKEYFGELYKTKPMFIFSLLVVICSGAWLNPVTIGWHDTPFTQYYSYEVQDQQGEWHPLNKNTMNPFHQWFQYDQFAFLVQDTVLEVSGFGYTYDYELAKELRQPTFDYSDLLVRKGAVKYDEETAGRFDDFIRTYFHNRNESADPVFLTALAPPYHLHTEICGENYSGNFKVKAFRVRLNVVVSVGSKYLPFSRNVVREILIPQ